MNREQAKEYIKEGIEDYLRRQGINPRKPFRCLNPEHPDSNPSMSYDRKRNKVHCFSCGADYDTLDLIHIDTGLEGNDLFLKAFELFGLTVENDSGYRRSTAQEDFAPAPQYQNPPKSEQHTQDSIHNTQPQADYMPYFKECQSRAAETDYFTRRGLSAETVAQFMLGYDPAYTKGTGGRSWKAAIIPTSKGTYTARNTDPEAEKKDRYRKNGGSLLYNLKALKQEEKPVFVTEGELDAISFYEVGGEAIALGSTANAQRLIKYFTQNPPKVPLILALDNDEDGNKTAAQLAGELTTLALPFYRLNPYGERKDANEALTADRAGFTAAVLEAIEETEREQTAELEAERENYLKTSTAYQLQSFINDIERSERAAFIPTGFPALDSVLDGGLYSGLYILGAVSSLGKSSFALQIADQIAQRGNDVIIFSLEMAKNELIAKSVSRHTLLEDLRQYQTTQHAKTTRGILTGSRYKSYSDTERGIIKDAINSYAEYAQNIYISVGMGDFGIDRIRETVERHIKLTGRTPAVVLDYLQIVSPADPRATDKANTDKCVLELKRLSRDYSLPVLAISSFNRDNYTAPVNLSSFKESGAIEYGSDVLLGLQYEGMDYKKGEKDGDREKRIRELTKTNLENGKNGKAQRIQVKVLKNRNGSKGEAVIEFYPMFNYFKEAATADTGESWIDELENRG